MSTFSFSVRPKSLCPRKGHRKVSKEYIFKGGKEENKQIKSDIIEMFKTYSIQHQHQFHKLQNVPFYDQGISIKSGFATCLFAEMLDIDVIIESGIAVGTSTEIFATYFKDKNIQHYGIDYTDPSFSPGEGKNHVWTSNVIFRETCKRLEHFGIQFIEGDSFVEIPEIFEKNDMFQDKRVLLFIDGPKENAQLELMDKMFARYPAIVFAACDDVGAKQKSSLYKKVSRKDIFMDYHKSLFVTDEAWFNDIYNFSSEKKECLGFAVNSLQDTQSYLKDIKGLSVD